MAPYKQVVLQTIKDNPDFKEVANVIEVQTKEPSPPTTGPAGTNSCGVCCSWSRRIPRISSAHAISIYCNLSAMTPNVLLS